MKNIMTKCLVFLLVLCMAVMIVACNNNEGDTTKKDDGTTTQGQGPNVPDGEPTTGGGNGGDVNPDPVDPLPEGDPNRDPGAADQF